MIKMIIRVYVTIYGLIEKCETISNFSPTLYNKMCEIVLV